MKEKKIHQISKWTKRLTAVAALGTWAYIMYTILNYPATFAELAPFCMVSTMVIFSVLTLIYKGLEYWERQVNT